MRDGFIAQNLKASFPDCLPAMLLVDIV